ncbi:MAG: zinc ribbon domain-containing protein [Gemmatimonadota bacterium]|jgi:putative FmdB family regulatory protein
MPTYEYLCPEGHHFEVFQRISEEPGADCPECGKPARRQISAGGGFLFKGEGFYTTDYRSDDYKKKASSEKGGDKGGDTKKGGDAKKGGDTKKASEADAPKSPPPPSKDD